MFFGFGYDGSHIHLENLSILDKKRDGRKCDMIIRNNHNKIIFYCNEESR